MGLAGNGYSGPIFLLVASLAGWVLVREAACLTAPLPVSARCWPIWPCDDADCDFTLFELQARDLAWPAGHRRRAVSSGRIPDLLYGGAWWLAYTAAGLVLPLAANAVYKKIKNAVLAH